MNLRSLSNTRQNNMGVMDYDFAGLKALFINCSIKKDKTKSHTQLLIDKAVHIMTTEGVAVEQIYALDHRIAFGMIKDGAEEGLKDDWPGIQRKIMAADILVIGTPIWLGVKSSVATQVIERMYAYSGDRNTKLYCYRQRRWHQALRHGCVVCHAAHRLYYPTPSRLRLDR
jgi:multimeric flavodoxin WrbA